MRGVVKSLGRALKVIMPARRFSGLLLIAIGILHTVVGLITGKLYLLLLTQAGFFSLTDPLETKAVLFWFLISGFVLVILGQLCYWVEHHLKQPLPKFLAWELLLIAMVGLLFMPISGFWLVLTLSIYMMIGEKPKP